VDARHHYELAIVGDEIAVRARVGALEQTVATAPLDRERDAVVLTVRCDPRSSVEEPDVLTLGYEERDERFVALAALPGRYLSTEVAGGFTGRVIGMYAVDGTAAFDWFDYEPNPPDD
jgi:hypothetical protein